MKLSQQIMVIMGSTRAGRLCPAITDWVVARARDCTPFDYQVTDLGDWPLPMDDEAGIPAGAAGYAHAHTRAWSEAVTAADGIVMVTPQYNWGYPAPLKNAIDHLYHEWRGKPLVIVSYGGHGGTKCAEQLKQVAGAVKMRVVAFMPALTLSDDVIRGAPIDPAELFKSEALATQQAFSEFAKLFDET